MPPFGFVGGSYTAQSNNIADEECINLYAETAETAGAQAKRSYFGTPGLDVFTAFPDGPVSGQCWTGTRQFVASGDTLYELTYDGTTVTQTVRMDGLFYVDGGPVSIAFSTIELLIVAGGRAYCYELAADTYTDVTSQLAGNPVKVKYGDGYFVVSFADSNKFQISAILDGTTWPGLQVNEVSVFAENITSIEVLHRELWVFGSQHIQPYQNSGSDEIYDVIPGALIETGNGPSFSPCVVDNSVFWISEDVRGARQAWRANGYTPLRLSTHAIETYLSRLSDISGLVSYSYQDGGHLFWVLYIPGTDCTWVYDVAEGLWHKRAEWHQNTATYGPHRSWNHVWAFGKHLMGDWESGNLYEMKLPYDTGGGKYAFVTDNGQTIRRLRRSPTLNGELERVFYDEIRVGFNVGMGPQPPLLDGDGNPRPPEAMLRWSNNSGSTWSNEHRRPCGYAGEYDTLVRWQRLGYGRRRLFELVLTDPIPWAITDAWIRTS